MFAELSTRSNTLFDLPAIPLPLLLAEVVLVIGVSIFAAQAFTDTSALTRLGGGEAEFLTSSVHYAANYLHTHGHIPLWQPFLGEGRPLVESPFAFIFNPISSGPSLIVGDGIVGVKMSVVLYALLACGGGWFCARAAGMSVLGRLLLALLLLGKGNMIALLGLGHFQLGVAQAYIPWVVGAALLILRGHIERWGAVLLGMAVALQFLAGNVWYTLPMLICLLLMTLLYIVPVRVRDVRRVVPLQVNWRGLRGMLLGAAITVGLSAVVLIPLWANRSYIGGQIPVTDGDRYASASVLLRQYVTPAPLVNQLDDALDGGELETRYNYTVPWWYLLVTFVLLPPAHSRLYRTHRRGVWRIWAVAVVLLIFFTMWGIGGLQPFQWAYNHIPGLGRWRFVGRAFGMASFWLAFIVVLRADGLWTAMLTWQLPRPLVQAAAGLLLSFTLLTGISVVNHNWREWVEVVPLEQPSGLCLAWMLTYREGEEPYIVTQENYRRVLLFMDLGIRHHPIPAAYRPLPLPFTYYDHDLRKETLPRFAMPTGPGELPDLREDGYRPVDSAPFYTDIYYPDGDWRCLWELPNALPYAYTVPIDEIEAAGRQLRPPLAEFIEPVRVIERRGGVIVLAAEGRGGESALVVAQEVAYPGWQVYVNGEQAAFESVGGQLGVRLPFSTATEVIAFVYRPRLVYIGASITIVTVLLCAVYLLRLDQRIRLRP